MATTIQPTKISMSAGIEPILRVAAWVSLAHAILWGGLYFRWVTFGSLGWDAFEFENALATLRPLLPYLIFGIGFVVDLSVGVLLLRKIEFGRQLGLVRGVVFVAGIFAYWFATGEFYGAVFALALAGFLLVLLTRNAAWAVNYPAAFWLIVFFVLPNVFIFVISLSERGPRGTILYPEFSAEGLRILFDDYGRFFGKIGGQYIYLRILWRSVMLATGNTILCLLLGYPFAYWIARRPEKWRNLFVFLVLIPFWTNGLVRIYAWIVMLRDSGLINTFWTSSIHNMAVLLSGSSGFFAWVADISANPIQMLPSQGAVFLGLFYGFLPFVVLPLYSNLEKLDWTLLEAAADLGANSFYSTTRILLPLSIPGIVAAGILVFVPSLGSFVVPALMGGGKVSMLGNLLQQQFMTSRDWPFGSAIGFLMMAIMLASILVYFRVDSDRREGR